MSRETDIKLLMDNWEEKHKNNGYKRFIRDGIVCEEKWEAQHTPRVCYFLKEASALSISRTSSSSRR